ncbi:hypothetical protein GCM10025770_21590 [Viridibacterium curvum]|uniref:Uncharacterized protein n=1 Tax=Viridibacterium curvum TaxID=1101404 RepID=A0ABP9QQH9_9RHOO
MRIVSPLSETAAAALGVAYVLPGPTSSTRPDGLSQAVAVPPAEDVADDALDAAALEALPADEALVPAAVAPPPLPPQAANTNAKLRTGK